MLKFYNGLFFCFKGKKTQTDFEKSLHFLTCNIAGLRRWNKFKDDIHLLFEIYGTCIRKLVAWSHGMCKQDKIILACAFAQSFQSISFSHVPCMSPSESISNNKSEYYGQFGELGRLAPRL